MDLISRVVSAVPAERMLLNEITVGHEEPPTYPSEWFANHPGSRPTIKLSSTGTAVQVLRETVADGILRSSLSLPAVKRYLYQAFVEHPSILPNNWTTFGVEIGVAGGRVTIGDILLYEVCNDVITPVTIPNITADDDLWICIYLCGIYRIMNISNDQYRLNVGSNINQQLSANRAPSGVTTGGYSVYRHFMADPDYLKLIAAIDMYLHKFKKHKFSPVRVGTITSRYKDCASLLDVSHLKTMTGMNCGAIGRWIWVSQLFKEMERLSLAGQEIDQADSYMPYMMEFALADKSPYSTAVNPHMHFWVHVIGCRLGNQRSKNAKNVGNVNTNALIIHGLLFGYAISKISEPDLTDYPSTLLGDTWCDWLKDHSNSLDEGIIKDCRRVFKLYGTARTDTVAKLLFEQYGQAEEA